MEVEPLSWDRKKGDIDVLVKFQHETSPSVTDVGNSGFECFVRGASKNDGQYYKN